MQRDGAGAMVYPADESTGKDGVPVLTNGNAMEEFARLNRTLQTLNAGHRTLLRATDELELLHDMCRVIVEAGGYRVASVVYAERDSQKSFRLMAKVGIETGLTGTFNFTWADSELGQTAIATAIRTGEPIAGRHLLTDPSYAGPAYAIVRESAIRMGYASVTAFPLRVHGEVLGALAMAAAEADAFDEEEVKLLGELADDLAYGIANLRTGVQHRAAQATIASLAYYDALTGLPNRALLRQGLDAAIKDARQEHRSLALLHLEVGRFHEINKVLGYHSGDELLQELGRRLAHASQHNETLARVGETEFALLLPNAGAEEAIEVARGLVNVVHQPVEVSGLMLDAQVGIGVALFPEHATDADSLIRRANAAMHLAKPARGGYAMYTGGQETENTRRLSLMGDLHRAVAHDELRLYCQPKVDFKTRRVCGAEALIRWEHPLKGMISPAEFIPLAEQAGMITPLTNWILETAFRQSHAWAQTGLDLPLAINLSALDLYDPELIDRISGLFTTWDIPPALIQFELTESALMVDPVEALEMLFRLKRLGIQLFIDDYGTGQSSLSYLQKLPVDAIKIDQSFVKPLKTSPDSALIVRSTIELGHGLGLKVVAEGVESLPVWECLVALECDVAQGYLISMPIPAAQFQGWESKWSGLSQ